MTMIGDYSDLNPSTMHFPVGHLYLSKHNRVMAFCAPNCMSDFETNTIRLKRLKRFISCGLNRLIAH